MLLSLREMCSELNISRRSIQCYEKAGLLKATSKNKYGHLQYDSRLLERVKKIRFFNEIGFKLCDIGTFIDATNEIVVERLRERLKGLEDETEKIAEQIINIKCMIESLKEEK